MADRTVEGLRAALKALREVVTPAVDPANPLATEQLRMACGYLALVCEQLPWRSARIAAEGRSALALATAQQPLATGCGPDAAAAVAALNEAVSAARALHAQPGLDEDAWQRSTAALGAASSTLVRCASTADDDTRRRIERAVVAHAAAWLDMERAWYRPLGFDTAASLPFTLEEALSRAAPTTAQDCR